MLKWVGILLILTGTGGLGLRMANELDLRIRELQALQQIVLFLNGEIRHLHRPLPEAFRSAGERTGEPFRDFLLRTATDLEQRNGRSARLIWERNLKNCAGGASSDGAGPAGARRAGRHAGLPGCEAADRGARVLSGKFEPCAR